MAGAGDDGHLKVLTADRISRLRAMLRASVPPTDPESLNGVGHTLYRLSCSM